jgi:drug/metabolite transporter (DMT)-like permease
MVPMTWRVLFAGLIAVAIWGTSPVATKIAVSELPGLDVAILRTGLGGVLALVVAVGLRMPWPRSTRQWWLMLLASFAGLVAFPLTFTFGQALTSATHGALILALMPVMTGLYTMAWDRQFAARLWWIGCAVALAGTALLIVTATPGVSAIQQSSVGGDLLILASTLCASLGYVAGGKLGQAGYASAPATFWGAAFMGVPLILIAAATGMIERAALASPSAQLSILNLAVGITIIGYGLWYWALSRGGIAKVATLQFLQPITGLILAFVVLAEKPALVTLAATAVIIGGVALARR